MKRSKKTYGELDGEVYVALNHLPKEQKQRKKHEDKVGITFNLGFPLHRIALLT